MFSTQTPRISSLRDCSLKYMFLFSRRDKFPCRSPFFNFFNQFSLRIFRLRVSNRSASSESKTRKAFVDGPEIRTSVAIPQHPARFTLECRRLDMIIYQRYRKCVRQKRLTDCAILAFHGMGSFIIDATLLHDLNVYLQFWQEVDNQDAAIVVISPTVTTLSQTM